jgi:hypothetical protein
MSLHKICKSIDTTSQEWRSYCLWRNRDFTSFDSLDSTIHQSMYSVYSESEVEDDNEWNYNVWNGDHSTATDVVNDFAFAQRYAQRCGADEILIFDFFETEDTSLHVVGYDILDGAFRYSLLTNFGNDITIVNDCLGPTGLIHDKDKALEVHRWFMDNMPDDHHVIGSRLFVVYDKFAEPGSGANRVDTMVQQSDSNPAGRIGLPARTSGVRMIDQVP